MRLLFIYFYKDFGTFEKGSLIHLSKKYKFYFDETNFKNNTFFFKKEVNTNFIEDFYTDKIDIGLILGENGTGKSILLNSIRDKENNYSFLVYENEENYFVSSTTNKKIFLNEEEVLEKKLTYVYYTSLLDSFDNELNDIYNVSNKALLKKYDGKYLDMKLKLIENSDIQSFFKMKQSINYNIKISGLKINYNKNFFSKQREKLFKKEFEKIYPILITNIKNKALTQGLEFIFEETKSFYNRTYKKVASNIPEENIKQDIAENLDFYLLNNLRLLKRAKAFLDRKINTKLANKIKYFKQEIKVSLESDAVQKSFQVYLQENKEFFLLENISAQTSINKYETESILDFCISYFTGYLKKYNIFELIDNEKLFYYVENDYYMISYVKKTFYEKFIKFLFDMLQIKNQSLEIFLNFKYIIHIFTENIDSYLEHLFKQSYKSDLKELKLKYDLLVKDYSLFYNVDENTKVSILNDMGKIEIKDIYFKIHDINIKKWLLILYLQDKYDYEVLSPKINLINNFLNILKSNITILEKKNIFQDLDKGILFKKKQLIEVDNNNCIEVNDTFFDFYKKLTHYDLNPFNYEVYPPLSSGQKAVLFIFSRINMVFEEIIKQKVDENILILLDEADLKLHLEWQRTFLNDLIEFLKNYKKNNIFVLYATHSPMILSDITSDRVVFLKKDVQTEFSRDSQDFNKENSLNIKNTFGANIYDIYSDSFFVNDFMGEFAKTKIQKLIEEIGSYKINELSNEKSLQLLKIVNHIGEPLLRNKLIDDIKFLSEEKNEIDIIIEDLKGKSFDEIKTRLSKYSNSMQKDILEKLFGS